MRERQEQRRCRAAARAAAAPERGQRGSARGAQAQKHRSRQRGDNARQERGALGQRELRSSDESGVVDAIPFSVYVSACGVFIESREMSAMSKDFSPPAGHDDSAASSALSLGTPRHCGISLRRRSNRHLSSALAAVLMHPRGFLGLCEMHPKVLTHSSAIPELACARTRTARRKAADTCLGQRWSRRSLQGEVPRLSTRLP